MSKLTLAVIFGGCSTEYSVSLQSVSAVIKAIDQCKYDVVLLGIDHEGQWFRFNGNVEQIANDTWRNDADCTRAFLSPCREMHGLIELDGERWRVMRIDAAFPVLHGKNGEDGTVQGLLELAEIPIVGCGTLSSALCMDKELAHIAAANAGISVPRGIALRSPAEAEFAMEKAAGLRYPLFVKPARAGSSFGIACVKRPEDLSAAVRFAFAHDNKVIIEEMIVGFEVGCAIMGSGNNLTIGDVDEIELTGDLFDFTEKYTLKTSKIHVPARITDETVAKIKNAAAIIYRALGCTGFARVDLFLTPTGEIVFNEVNTIPGFTAHSRFPNMMKSAGLSFEALINRLIETAVTE